MKGGYERIDGGDIENGEVKSKCNERFCIVAYTEIRVQDGSHGRESERAFG